MDEGPAPAPEPRRVTGPARTRLQRIRERLDEPGWRAYWQRTGDAAPSEAGDTVDATEDFALLLQLAEAAARDDDDGVLSALEALEETFDEE